MHRHRTQGSPCGAAEPCKGAVPDDVPHKGAVADAVSTREQADRLYDAGDEEAANKTHRPNLLNTVVWLVETAQQVAVMLVLILSLTLTPTSRSP